MNYLDLHCDTITQCYNKRMVLEDNLLQVALNRAMHMNKWVQVYAIWLDDALTGKEAYTYFNNVYRYFKEQMATNPKITWAKTFKDITEGFEENKFIALLAIENSKALNHDLNNVRVFYEMGVRLMTLTWNTKGDVADGCMLENAKGLTEFGKSVVDEMTKTKMIIDVSHLSEKGFWDVVSRTQQSFVATHSNSYSVCGHLRNLKDDQFKEIVSRKGVVGMNFYPLFINGTYKAVREELLKHIDHFLTLGGEDVLTIGSDFDGAKMPVNLKGIQDITLFYKDIDERYGEKLCEKLMFTNGIQYMKDHL